MAIFGSKPILLQRQKYQDFDKAVQDFINGVLDPLSFSKEAAAHGFARLTYSFDRDGTARVRFQTALSEKEKVYSFKKDNEIDRFETCINSITQTGMKLNTKGLEFRKKSSKIFHHRG